MKNQILYIFLLFTIISNTSCGTIETEAVDSQPAYFSLKTFFTNEIQRLNNDKVALSKVAEVSGETETKELTAVDWEKELQIFKASDINKPAWRDSYSIDTVVTSMSKIINYKAIDDKLKIKLVALVVNYRDNNKIVQIDINTTRNNALYDMKEKLVYQPEQGYQINTTQTIAGATPDVFRINGTFK